MIDLILRNAVLPDGRSGLNLAIDAGRFVEVAPLLGAETSRKSRPGRKSTWGDVWSFRDLLIRTCTWILL